MLEQEQQYKTILIDTFKNVAKHKMSLLSRLKLSTVYDLIFNLPFRYEDHTYVQPLCDLFDEQTILESPCTVIFTVVSESPEQSKKATVFLAQDISGTPFTLTYFNCPEFITNHLLENPWFIGYGVVSYNNYSDMLNMVHPKVEPLSTNIFELPKNLSPVYHLTRGIGQEFMRRLEERALSLLVAHPLDELLPSALNPFHITLTEALLITHNPPPSFRHTGMVIEALPSFRRICFEELVAYKLAISFMRDTQDNKQPLFIPFDPAIYQTFLNTLPFKPTKAQTRAFYEVMLDCCQKRAMSRLVNGDVGSGKTLVAALCMLQCAQAGMQTVLMAPTEILAQQHHHKLSQMFAPLGFEVGLLTGSLKRKERTDLLKQCASGELKIIVGTHALFQKAVHYHCLALVIIDEQHRFGVNERDCLLQKAPTGYAAHELLMTATPIPRSLRLALFQDTAVSILNEMPHGRLPIKTSLVESKNLLYLVERLRYQCRQGEQAFWICPFVDEQDNATDDQMQTIKPISVKRRLSELQQMMPDIRIGMIHGKMSEKEKNDVMADFLAQRYQILVATVIVEVGVDVPNASIIVIEDPQMMGLSQLHQLRGRVGRGTKQSYCILLYRMNDDKAVATPRSKTKRTTTYDAKRMAGVAINQESYNDLQSADDQMYDSRPNDRTDLESEVLTPENMKVSQRDLMDWNSDPELTAQLQEILKAPIPISMKRLNILKCTCNGFAIASQDMVLRGPGEFFGQNQTGNENFRFANLVRDYRMLERVNKTANQIYMQDQELALALVERWYPAFNELVTKQPDTTKLQAEIQAMDSPMTEDTAHNEWGQAEGDSIDVMDWNDEHIETLSQGNTESKT